MVTSTVFNFDEQISQLDSDILDLQMEKSRIMDKIDDLRISREHLEKQKYLDQIKRNRPAHKWFVECFPWSQKLHRLLIETFNLSTFRTNQLAAINAILSKKDVVVIMPPGSGKSLIYQMVAMVRVHHLSVVVSPLISLIENQLHVLKKLNIPAAALHFTISAHSKRDIFLDMLKGKIKILFLTPEQFVNNKKLLRSLEVLNENGRLDQFVIDEVHCCSQWRYNFRQAYQQLALLKHEYPEVPILGLTSTATLTNLMDIQTFLNLNSPVLLRSSYSRDNIFYQVRRQSITYKKKTNEYITLLLKKKYQSQSVIVYCGTRKESLTIDTQLRAEDIKSGLYHAGMKSEDKTSSHKEWLDKAFDVMVATNAFGMGINKSDVRVVIHYSVPKCFENFYQESGRAGWDGQPADSILFYSLHNWIKNYALTMNINDEGRAIDMLKFCMDRSSCRRKLIAKYFDDKWARSVQRCCDNCEVTFEQTYDNDISPCLTAIVEIIKWFKDTNVNCTLNRLLNAWYKNTRLKPDFDKTIAEDIIAHLIIRNILKVKRLYYNSRMVIPYIDYGELPCEPVTMQYDKPIEGLTQEDEERDNEIEFIELNENSDVWSPARPPTPFY